MITLRELQMMKPSAYIINTSRGPAINEADLTRALNAGIVAGAALDVFKTEPTPMSNPLRQVDAAKVIITPHNIGANPGSSDAGQRMAAQSILSILEGKVPDTVVNPDAIDPWRQRFWS
jgi:D-3-phosphoglycerate dehydrogenase